MQAYPKWTEEEDDAIRLFYPSRGAEGTVKELKSMNYNRTAGAVKEHAKHLGVRRDRRLMEHDNAWSDEELSVMRREFPLGGAARVKDMLTGMGYDRTIGAINTRASMLGLKKRNKVRRMERGGTKVQINLCMDSVLDNDVIEHLKTKRNRSMYVRDLIARDMIGQS